MAEKTRTRSRYEVVYLPATAGESARYELVDGSGAVVLTIWVPVNADAERRELAEQIAALLNR